ncbi:1075_t:CDS:2, partial [Dentiscutata heterogama]
AIVILMIHTFYKGRVGLSTRFIIKTIGETIEAINERSLFYFESVVESIVCSVFKKICILNRPNNNQYQNFWPGGGGGGFYPRYDSFDQYSSQSGNTHQNFWTGLGLGALGGYFLGRNSESQRPRSRTTIFTSPSSSRSSSSRSSNMTNSQ